MPASSSPRDWCDTVYLNADQQGFVERNGVGEDPTIVSYSDVGGFGPYIFCEGNGLQVTAIDAPDQTTAADALLSYGDSLRSDGFTSQAFTADTTGYLEGTDEIGGVFYNSGDTFFTLHVDLQRGLRVVLITVSDYSGGAGPVARDVAEQQMLEVARTALVLNLPVEKPVEPSVAKSLPAALDFPGYSGPLGTEAHAASVTAARDALDSFAQELGCTEIETLGNDGLSDWNDQCYIAGSQAYLYIIQDLPYETFIQQASNTSSGFAPASDWIREGTFLAVPMSPEAGDAIRAGLSRAIG